MASQSGAGGGTGSAASAKKSSSARPCRSERLLVQTMHERAHVQGRAPLACVTARPLRGQGHVGRPDAGELGLPPIIFPSMTTRL
jgi:hypothetical protein